MIAHAEIRPAVLGAGGGRGCRDRRSLGRALFGQSRAGHRRTPVSATPAVLRQGFRLGPENSRPAGLRPSAAGIVSASLKYLEGLASQVQHDPDLAQEVADGYWQIAQIQGLPTGLNLGKRAQAEASLKKADSLTNVVLAARPGDRPALERSGFIAQGRMILAEQDHHRAEALAHARETADRANRLLQQPQLRVAEIDDGAVLFQNVALAHTNMIFIRMPLGMPPISGVGASAPSESVPSRAGLEFAGECSPVRGRLDGALRAIEEARNIGETAVYQDSAVRTIQLYGVILRRGLILGEDGGGVAWGGRRMPPKRCKRRQT